MARRTRLATVEVYIETGMRRVFAAALDWPGWCRAGRDEETALGALAAALPRYGEVAAAAGVAFPGAVAFEVVERLPGSATTDFGAPDARSSADFIPLAASGARNAALLAACWEVFDRIAAGAPLALRKGPRGGGRDRDAIVEHVLSSEASYSRKVGIRLSASTDPGAVGERRAALLDLFGSATEANLPVGKGWPLRYAARRIAWHVLDHAWEIEDRS